MYLRPLAELNARPIAGTEAVEVASPIFSPDGRSVVFWSGTERALKSVPVSGGRAARICETEVPFGISWTADGLVVGTRQHGIVRVSPTGGVPEVLVSVKPDEAAYAPQVLPGGRAMLFTLASGALLDNPRLVVQPSDSAVRTTIIEGASDGRYVPTGHIVYAQEGNLRAVAFDMRSLRVTSAPVPVLEGVMRTALTSSGRLSGMAQWQVSASGVFVYAPGRPPSRPSCTARPWLTFQSTRRR
ncbi:MAG TPA: hypothetical protein VKE96_12210 [Vicinamibacterales bacterium]|nr:hypothetical protein [Vicinamibacterales bacterium]